MGPGTSPNDPIFFLHHCNIDRIWAGWQVGKTIDDVVPNGEGPCGHNRKDAMYPWDGLKSLDVVTPEDMWDTTGALDYDYDALPQVIAPPI